MSAVRIMAGGALLWAAWDYYANRGRVVAANIEYDPMPGFNGGGVVQQVTDAAEAAADYLEGAMARLNLSAMRTITAATLANENVQAFLKVIRAGEGTADAGGYSRLYGGGKFSGYADHPRVKVTAGRWTSTAAGAYQFLSSTWDETARIMGLKDFSPQNQDLAALGRIAARGALADVMRGDFESAVRKCAWEWASLPGSPYGQPVISWERARSVFASAGGVAVA